MEPFKLTFMTPRLALVSPGRHQPCLLNCSLTIAHDLLVTVTAPSRDQVFAQARRWLEVVCKGLPPDSTCGTLTTPHRPGCPGGRDQVVIAIGAQVSFSFSAVPADVGAADAFGLPAIVGDGALNT